MKAFQFKFMLPLLLFGFIITSCDKEEESLPEETSFSSENSARAAKVDNIAESSFNIMERAFVENETQGKGLGGGTLFPACTEITVGVQGNKITILLDFGESCTLNNGNIVSGSIFMEYGPLISGTYTIEYAFQDFVFNGNGVSGGGEILYEIANSNGNPQSTVNETITVSFPGNSVTGTRTGLRVSEWVEGVGSGNWQDNVYHVTGHWQTVFSNGFERSGKVITPLVFKNNCRYIVEGKLEVAQDGLTAMVDFGDGTCDNMAVFIFNGQEYPFVME